MADKRVGVVGARGYVGAELLRLIAAHPSLALSFASSRALAGKPLREVAPSGGGFDEIVFEDLGPREVAAREVDALVLALPNGAAAEYLAALTDQPPVVVDLSADHRFDDDWHYGLVERRREQLRGATRIANPGCYATAAQLALGPLVERLASAPRVFGVSGYSGAGTAPSDRNDPEKLRDNLMPYGSIDHTHEREIGRHLGRAVHFMPHVAAFFRGISLTIDCELKDEASADELFELFEAAYANEPLVRVGRDAPLVRDAVGRHTVQIGGFATRGQRAVVFATIDNLLKGAATQAMQNLNLSLGLDELCGIAIAS